MKRGFLNFIKRAFTAIMNIVVSLTSTFTAILSNSNTPIICHIQQVTPTFPHGLYLQES